MSKQTLIVGTANIAKAVKSIAARGAKLDADIQLTGVSILAHINEHSNITLLNDLYHSLPKGSRKNALAEWAVANGKVSINEGANRKDMPFLFAKDKVTNIELAWEKPWYDFAPPPDLIQVFDVQAAIAKVLKAAAKASKDNPDVEIKGADLLEKLAGLV